MADAPYIGDYLVDAWAGSYCEEIANGDADLLEKCSGNSGAYRGSLAAFVFYVVFGIAAVCRPTSNREAWPAKYVLFLFLIVATIFLPNEPLILPIYMHVARAGSVLFILFQQVVLVDVAYNWNESWVGNAENAELAQGPGAGKKWLAAVLAACGILYVASFAGIVTMYVHFSGCQSNETFISVTLIMSIVCTAVQLRYSDSASLLTSAAVTAYATYLCLAAVSKNPDSTCNPKLGENDPASVAVGLILAGVSLLWAGWSYTADDRVGGGKKNGNGGSGGGEENGDEEEDNQYTRSGSGSGSDGGGKPAAATVGGVVANDEAAIETTALASSTATASADPSRFGNSWKLNAVLALVACWYATALTGWGTVHHRGDAANPDVGRISMWMIIAGQWVVLSLYLWTLSAPTLFPDRDFS